MQPENELSESPEHVELRLKIRSIRETCFGSYEKAGAGLGFNKNTIASYEKGLTLPDIDYLFVFADRTGADINELIRLRLACSRYPSVRALVSAASAVQTQTRLQNAPPADSFNVPVARHIVTTEAGEEIDVPSKIAQLSLSRAWLAERGIQPINLIYTRMPDDSMSPTVRPGAVIVIDTTTDTLRGDGLYAFHYGDAMPIKRLQIKFDGGLWIRSDNPAYRDEELNKDEAARLNILGKAIWAGGEL
jgi:phage repressor protein C with HTH and peptisase S24 domain